jgi:hypothetical protein
MIPVLESLYKKFPAIRLMKNKRILKSYQEIEHAEFRQPYNQVIYQISNPGILQEFLFPEINHRYNR